MSKASLLLLVSALQAPLASTQQLQALQEFSLPSRVNRVAFDADVGYGVTCDDDGQVILWNLTSGQADQTMTTPSVDCDAMAVDFASMQALAGYSNNEIKLWDLSTGTLNFTLNAPAGVWGVPAIDWNTMQAVIHTCCHYQFWDLMTGMANQTISASANDDVADINRMEALICDLGGRIRLYDLVEGNEVRSVDLSRNKLQTMAADFAARRAITAGDDGVAWLINLDDMSIIGQNMSNHSNGIRKVVADFSAMRAITGSIDGTAVYWDLSTTSPIYTLQHGAGSGSSYTVQNIVADFNAMQAVTSGNDGQVVLWDLSSGTALSRETRHGSRIKSMVADMSKEFVFTGGNNGASTKAIYWSFATTTTTTTSNTTTGTSVTATMTTSISSTSTMTTMTTTTMTMTMTTTDTTTMTPMTTNTLLVVDVSGSTRTSPRNLEALGLAALAMVLAQALFAASPASGTPKL